MNAKIRMAIKQYYQNKSKIHTQITQNIHT